MIKVLFVCMGNICRSPSAEGIFKHIVEQKNQQHLFEIDSAGTHAYHIGKQPDIRSQQTALKYSIDISQQKARIVCASDYHHYDYIIAMDNDNLAILQHNCPAKYLAKLHKLLDFLPNSAISSVPDPYFGNNFDFVYKLIYDASEYLLININKNIV